MKSLFFLLLLSCVYIANGQYYFNDILTTKQTNKQYSILKQNKIRQVSATSYEADGSLTEDFILSQQISANGASVITTAEYPSSGKSISTSWYTNDKINKTVDSADNVKNTTTYTYDNNNIVSISTFTEDTFMHSASVQTHLWFYENETPVKMLLIKDNTDTTVVEFVKDEHGNVAEEHWKKKGRNADNYFYYYNEKHLLTDIVHFNLKAQRLLPDFLFEYDEQGTLIQFTQIPQGSDDYLVWQYVYNANGLKEKELCFNKTKQPVGRIEYTYR
jgi:hypothetical protein